MKLLLPFLIGASLIVSACGGESGDNSGSHAKGSPAARAKGFLKASVSGDIEKIKGYMPPSTIKSDEAKERQDRFYSITASGNELRAEKKGGIEEIKVNSTDVDGDAATVELTVIWGNGATEPATVKLKNIDGKWYVTR